MKSPKKPCSAKCSATVSFDLVFSDYLDKNLSEHQRILIENHLADCPTCREAVHEMKTIGEIASELVEVAIPSSVQQRLRDNLRKQLNDQLFKQEAKLVVIGGGRS